MKYALAAAVAASAIVFAVPAGAATLVARPTYKTAEATVASPWIVVHYTRTGPDHPRFMKDDNHNGVPNYIEKLAAAANKAWLWYAHNGFKGPLPDAAGPDARLDIYVKALPPGVFGITPPATVANGGSFMVIDNQLDMAHLAVHGSLQQTVAHELFHEFQLAYMPDGRIPHWAAEGSAVAMQTYVYPQVVDAATFSYLDAWLNQPWRSLYDEAHGCSHCYGGALFWRFLFSLGNHVVPEYFGRLYGYEQAHKPILLGLQPLDEILRKRTHGSLYSAFGRFSYDIYRSGFKPVSPYKLTASTSVTTTRTRVVRGLSTHYIPIAMPADAKGIGVGVAAASGPNPEVKVVVGGPKGRVIEGIMRQKGELQYFVTTFRNAKERASAMLIVTSGRQIGTAYKVAYQSL
jgi:hypothetical protein